MSQKSGLIPSKGKNIVDLTFNRVRLIGRLLLDTRVNLFLKLLPVSSLVYLVMPDLFPFNPIDDAMIIWLGAYLFVEWCPEQIVAEHQQALSGTPKNETINGEWNEVEEEKPAED